MYKLFTSFIKFLLEQTYNYNESEDSISYVNYD